MKKRGKIFSLKVWIYGKPLYICPNKTITTMDNCMNAAPSGRLPGLNNRLLLTTERAGSLSSQLEHLLNRLAPEVAVENAKSPSPNASVSPSGLIEYSEEYVYQINRCLDLIEESTIRLRKITGDE